MKYRLLIISYVPEFSNSKDIAIKVKDMFQQKLRDCRDVEFNSIEMITSKNHNRVMNELSSFSYFLKDPNCRAYIYYYGHGDQVRDYNGDEQDGRDEIWKTQDILDDTISNFFKDINEKSRLYLFSDSCSSGSMIDKKISQSNWVTISSCNDIQDSLATSDGGVFTLWGLIPSFENIKNPTPLLIHRYVLGNLQIPSQKTMLHFGKDNLINEKMF